MTCTTGQKPPIALALPLTAPRTVAGGSQTSLPIRYSILFASFVSHSFAVGEARKGSLKIPTIECSISSIAWSRLVLLKKGCARHSRRSVHSCHSMIGRRSFFNRSLFLGCHTSVPVHGGFSSRLTVRLSAYQLTAKPSSKLAGLPAYIKTVRG
jgi:hypothetical protein